MIYTTRKACVEGGVDAALQDLPRPGKKPKPTDKQNCLANDETLSKKYRDHALGGNWSDYRECHIKPDWLLIYRAEPETPLPCVALHDFRAVLGLWLFMLDFNHKFSRKWPWVSH
jgi:addiction module RelE/StbE family toxin